jgi:hypothetical protein
MKYKKRIKNKVKKINPNTEFAIFAVPVKEFFKKEKPKPMCPSAWNRNVKLPKNWGLIEENRCEPVQD